MSLLKVATKPGHEERVRRLGELRGPREGFAVGQGVGDPGEVRRHIDVDRVHPRVRDRAVFEQFKERREPRHDDRPDTYDARPGRGRVSLPLPLQLLLRLVLLVHEVDRHFAEREHSRRHELGDGGDHHRRRVGVDALHGARLPGGSEKGPPRPARGREVRRRAAGSTLPRRHAPQHDVRHRDRRSHPVHRHHALHRQHLRDDDGRAGGGDEDGELLPLRRGLPVLRAGARRGARVRAPARHHVHRACSSSTQCRRRGARDNAAERTGNNPQERTAVGTIFMVIVLAVWIVVDRDSASHHGSLLREDRRAKPSQPPSTGTGRAS